MENKTIYGIIAFVLGILVMLFPIASDMVLSAILGISFVLLGVYYIVISSHTWKFSKGTSALYIILGLIGLISGGLLLGNILAFELFVGAYFYIIGLMLLVSGLIRIFQSEFSNLIAVFAIILGIITLILGYFAMLSPVYVAIIIGAGLIVNGFGLIIRD